MGAGLILGNFAAGQNAVAIAAPGNFGSEKAENKYRKEDEVDGRQ
jgi:hypothetical protein